MPDTKKGKKIKRKMIKLYSLDGEDVYYASVDGGVVPVPREEQEGWQKEIDKIRGQ